MRLERAIETRDLGKRYGARWALRDCSLVVPSGSVTALVGPNGAGKTTLLHLLIGLSTPSSGFAVLAYLAQPGLAAPEPSPMELAS
jgi:ABC-2 type transport system ATP-binding protein